MSEFLKILAPFCALFVASVFAAYLIGKRKVPAMKLPPINTKLKLRQGACVMKSHVLDVTPQGIWVSAPRMLTDVVPIRPTESFCIEFTDDSGLTIFHSRVLDRRSDHLPALLLEMPSKVIHRDRRSEPRYQFEPPVQAVLDDRINVQVCDMSPGGARVRSGALLEPGSTVGFRLHASPATVFGWVLDSKDAGPFAESRILFERKVPAEYIAAFKNSIA